MLMITIGTDTEGKETAQLIRKLVNIGKNGTSTYKTPVTTISKTGSLKLVGDYYIQNYKVTSNVEMKSFNATITGFPSGTKITNTSGTEKTTFNANETVQIRINKNQMNKDISGKIRIEANTKSYPVFYGKTYDESLQNYAVTFDPIALVSSIENLQVKTNTGIIKVLKVDEETNKPVENVMFELSTEDGKKIKTGVTDKDGKLIFDNLYQDNYILREIKSNDDYEINNQEIRVEVTYNQTTEIKVTNKHKKGNLRILKVDADNHEQTLGGIEFELLYDDGTKYDLVTDADGIIELNNINTGNPKLIEKRTKKEYKLNDEQVIQIVWNETTDLVIENEKYKSQIEVYKTDAEDNEWKLEGVKFDIFDKNMNYIETITTDKNGYAQTSKIAIGGKTGILYAKEIETDELHVLNDELIKVDIEADTIATLNLTNERIKGQIKIIKTSEDDNFINNTEAGTPIQNVDFEVYDSNYNLVDELTTAEDGTAITKLLDKGIYYIREVSSGEWYLLNENEFTAEIINHGEIVEVNITNESEKPDVDIEKTGIIQTTANQEIKYDFNIKNTGNVPLDKFTWYDYLPTDYVRITKLITGTYNQDLNYSIYYKTNKNDYKLLKDNLNTQVNNYIDFSNIELEADEYITEFKADFGTVDVGFESVINPYIFVRVNSDVQNDDVFTNKTRIEGYNKTYMVWDEDDHTTKIYEKKVEVKKLPRTGF